MKLGQLNHFLVVVERGSLGRAARHMNISEPALSKSIRNLERELDVQLLDRGPRGMTPTVFGEALAARARLIRSESNLIRREFAELKGVSRGIVRIGARPSFGAAYLPTAVARFHHKWPGIRAVVREGMMNNMVSELIHGELDVIVVTLADTPPDDDLVQEDLMENPVGIVARHDHPLATRKALAAKDLGGFPWVRLLGSDPVHNRFQALLASNGLQDIDIVVESESVRFLMSYICKTDALGFFPENMIEEMPSGERLAILDAPGMAWRRQLGFLRRRHTSPTPAARALIEEIKTVCNARAGAGGSNPF